MLVGSYGKSFSPAPFANRFQESYGRALRVAIDYEVGRAALNAMQ